MSASKKDYEAVAGVLNKVAREHDLTDQQAFCQTVIDLAAMFKGMNPGFLFDRFFEAVYKGVPPSEGSGGGAPPRGWVGPNVPHFYRREGPNPYCTRCQLPRKNAVHR